MGASKRILAVVAAGLVVAVAGAGAQLVIARVASQPSFLGAWNADDGETLEFRRNGTILTASGSSWWTARGETLTFANQRYTWDVSPDGKALTLSSLDDQGAEGDLTITYRRP
jgi:hypothetical protein